MYLAGTGVSLATPNEAVAVPPVERFNHQTPLR
jgi:hypothetical protein